MPKSSENKSHEIELSGILVAVVLWVCGWYLMVMISKIYMSV